MTKEEIKAWLDGTGNDRAWLGRQCAVSKSTVDGWFAQRPIPKPAMATIERLAKGEMELNPKVTLEKFVTMQKLSDVASISVEEFLASAVDEKIERELKKLKK